MTLFHLIANLAGSIGLIVTFILLLEQIGKSSRLEKRLAEAEERVLGMQRRVAELMDRDAS